ncbi:unnamed protein product [Cylindrotheca closterium]|uniref:Uncharacterized protein n=1 Tax=Cylindrotheca closterium TaxID=2856 RepID=A0AAD2CHV3_9STRA|nr:unnamed protein product [Cylindrotheca closterium]
MFHAIPYAEEFAVKKRALDVALKGYSDVKQPKRASSSFISIRTPSFKLNAKSSSQLIIKTMDEQRHILEGLDESIHTEVMLVNSILVDHTDGSSTADDNIPNNLKSEVLDAMRSIKGYQKEYVRVLRVMEGIKVVEVAMQDGFLDPRKVAKCLNEILKVTWKSRAHSQSQQVMASDSKLLHQLQQEEFFPYLNSRHPGQVFFRSEKPKRRDEELHLVRMKGASAGNGGPCSTDSSSMPALSSICSESVVSASVYGDSQYSCYAPSEVSSSAPNSPRAENSWSNRNKLIPADFVKNQQQTPVSIPDFDSRDTLIPSLALRHPETTILDFLSPTLEMIVPKERPSRWGSCSGSSSDTNMSKPLHKSEPPGLMTTKVDATPSYLRDCLPTRPPSFAKRATNDSFSYLEEKSNDSSSLIGMDEMFCSLDSVPSIPARRGSGDSRCIKEEILDDC